MSKQSKHKALPQFRKNLKAKAAAGAHATAGRSRIFADKADKLAKQSANPEIAEGLEEYEAKRAGWSESEALEKARAKRGDTYGVKVEIIVDLTKIPKSPNDASVVEQVRHWIENETKWPDYFISVNVKE